MKKQIRNLENKTESFQIHPDEFSQVREVRAKITGKRSKLLDTLWDVDAKWETQEGEIQKLKTAKDTAFDFLRTAKVKSNEMVDQYWRSIMDRS